MDSGIADGDADDEGAELLRFCRPVPVGLPVRSPSSRRFENHAVPYQVVGSEPLLFRRSRTAGRCGRLKKLFYSGSDPSISLAVTSDIWGMIKKGDRDRGRAQVPDGHLRSARRSDTPSRLLRRAVSAVTTMIFSGHVSLRQGADDRDDRAEAVSLMTIHASKGLEFDTVFIPACEKGIIPFELFGDKDGEEMAEEERLFYVGVTRTLENLYLTHAKKRAVKGRILKQERSTLIDRLEEGLLAKGKRGQGKKPPSGDVQLDMFN